MPKTEADAEVSQLFGQLYLHLHPRRGASEYRPNRASLALLRHLAVSGPLTVAEACKHFGRSQAATSETLSRLMTRGLVARHEDERDRRRHLVWLTEEGRRVVSDESQPLDRGLVAAVLGRMNESKRQQLLAGLRSFADAALQHAQSYRKEHQDE